MRDEDVVVHSESAARDMAITWSMTVWARAPPPWPARERAALMAGYVRAVAHSLVLPLPAWWSCLIAGGSGLLLGLFSPLADAGTLLRYAMGECACIAGPRPELVGRAIPVSISDPAERGVCPNVVLRVRARPSLHRATPEVVVAPPATCWALLPGFTIQPLVDGPLLAFLAGAAPAGFLAASVPFLPLERTPPGDLLDEGDGPEPQAGNADCGVVLNVDEDDEYVLD